MVNPDEMRRLGVLRDRLVERTSSYGGFQGAGIQPGVGGGRLVLYVVSLDCEAAKMAPATIDNIPVDVQRLGTVRPL